MSSPKKPKWYVVWEGNVPGIYTSWESAKRQIHGVAGAKYKSYESANEARDAFEEGAPRYAPSSRRAPVHKPSYAELPIILPSFAVDAACDMTTGVMEYRGVDIDTGAEIFRMGPYQDSSNNLGEFLAIVHCLGFCKQRNLNLAVYTDSRTALSWVRNRFAKTTVIKTPGNDPVFKLIARAEQWLKDNAYPNKLIKWDTKQWGENPADFGRK